jgi:hypothetical protein
MVPVFRGKFEAEIIIKLTWSQKAIKEKLFSVVSLFRASFGIKLANQDTGNEKTGRENDFVEYPSVSSQRKAMGRKILDSGFESGI